MARKLDVMDIKQILKLKESGTSNRKTAALLGISRNTINHYVSLFNGCGLSYTELQELDESSLNDFFPEKSTVDKQRHEQLSQYFECMDKSRFHPGFTLLYHWYEYQNMYDNPYGYTQFAEHYKRQHAHLKGSMKLDHKAGERLYIDFAGTRLQLVDKETGEQIKVEVFVSILPSSQYTYVEACKSQKREDLIHCMNKALRFYGGVPAAIVSDNLKSSVKRVCKYEPVINKTFKDFALHYGSIIYPTRTYSPQDKALVESAVNLVYQRIYYPLRNMIFFSLSDLNKEISRLLEHYNDYLFQQEKCSRRELFESIERQYLKPLPESFYQIRQYKRAKVQKLGYVFLSEDRHYYSVPYRFIGKQVEVQYTGSFVEVLYHSKRIAAHKRDKSPRAYTTLKDHLASTHQAYTDWNPDYFKKLAKSHGEYVMSYVAGILQQGDFMEANYKRAMGVIQLSKEYSSDRLNKACERASYGNQFSYNVVKNILKQGLDREQIQPGELNQTVSHIPKHDNLRGPNEYQ